MARKRDTPYVVFGSGERANKGLFCAKIKGFHTAKIVELDPEQDYGADFPLDAISGEYVDLIFCKKESLQAFIACMLNFLTAWEKEENNGCDDK